MDRCAGRSATAGQSERGCNPPSLSCPCRGPKLARGPRTKRTKPRQNDLRHEQRGARCELRSHHRQAQSQVTRRLHARSLGARHTSPVRHSRRPAAESRQGPTRAGQRRHGSKAGRPLRRSARRAVGCGAMLYGRNPLRIAAKKGSPPARLAYLQAADDGPSVLICVHLWLISAPCGLGATRSSGLDCGGPPPPWSAAASRRFVSGVHDRRTPRTAPRSLVARALTVPQHRAITFPSP
jgi:hypothetical protein